MLVLQAEMVVTIWKAGAMNLTSISWFFNNTESSGKRLSCGVSDKRMLAAGFVYRFGAVFSHPGVLVRLHRLFHEAFILCLN